MIGFLYVYNYFLLNTTVCLFPPFMLKSDTDHRTRIQKLIANCFSKSKS